MKTGLLLPLAFLSAMLAVDRHAGAQTMAQAAFDAEVQGAHDMKGLVTAVDHRTGLVELTAGSMELRLHFPPPAVQKLNEGDTLFVRLGIKEIKGKP